MSQIVTVQKIKDEAEPTAMKAETTAKDWQKVSETETTMTIEILD